jgi:hypothetical protein
MLDYIRAEDFDRAWLNFELDLPLQPLRDGRPNPFYVQRPGDATGQLHESLVAPFHRPPKYFFSGHRGCGKSTELRRLAVDPAIQAKYYPIHFTIRDEADINNLDFKDVLLAIGGRMYREYSARGRDMPTNLQAELNAWRGNITDEIVNSARIQGFEVGGNLTAFFAEAGLKVKLEPATRTILRQIIERDVTGLIAVIDKIAEFICVQENRMPLILIDDLDKADMKTAQSIFYEHCETMTQPRCAIVYTVSSPIYYSHWFEAIRDNAIFLPNINLHTRGSARPDRAGQRTMREFIGKRVNLDLMTHPALKHAVNISGGVFRELARVMRFAIRYGRRSGKIQLDHVRLAEAEIRGEYRRILTSDQRATLARVHESNQFDEPDKMAPLLEILAVLEYADAEPWCDIHPALVPLLHPTPNVTLDPPAEQATPETPGA